MLKGRKKDVVCYCDVFRNGLGSLVKLVKDHERRMDGNGIGAA
jgi:hypothetical protein